MAFFYSNYPFLLLLTWNLNALLSSSPMACRIWPTCCGVTLLLFNKISSKFDCVTVCWRFSTWSDDRVLFTFSLLLLKLSSCSTKLTSLDAVILLRDDSMIQYILQHRFKPSRISTGAVTSKFQLGSFQLTQHSVLEPLLKSKLRLRTVQMYLNRRLLMYKMSSSATHSAGNRRNHFSSWISGTQQPCKSSKRWQYKLRISPRERLWSSETVSNGRNYLGEC